MDNPGSDENAAGLAGTTRTEGFSDAVFAIVITLLAVEIHRPEVEPGGLTAALIANWPSYAAYLLAFLYVGIIWLNHHRLFRLIRRVDIRLLWINLFGLGMTALIPFPTELLAGAFQEDNLADQRIAVVAYAIVAGLMSASWLIVFPYLARHPELTVPGLGPDYFRRQYPRPIVGVVAYTLAGVIAWFVHPLAGLAFIVFMVGFHTWTSEGLRASRPADAG